MTPEDITRLLNKWLTGDESARNELFEIVYDTLRRMAKHYMLRENRAHTLQPTALVNEAFIKLQTYKPDRWQNRAHFYAVFSRAMRQVVVDHAREKLTHKRGAGQQKVSLDDVGEIPARYYENLIELDSVLDQLTHWKPEASAVFHLKHFVGLTADEISALLKFNVTKVNRLLSEAKKWLRHALGPGENASGSSGSLSDG